VEDDLPCKGGNHINLKAMPPPIALQYAVTTVFHSRHCKILSELSGPGAAFQNHAAMFATLWLVNQRNSGMTLGS
tara:strand:- start:58 stop:282 length:225 start_codon:yes stop_codon:yes gene_type:complete